MLDHLLPPAVHWAGGPIADHTASLFPEELEVIASAVEKRRLEFSTGRALARRVLREMGFGGPSLPRDADRVPRWPEGVVGSISHARGACLVAVAHDRECGGLGIDLEPDAPVDFDLARVICAEQEKAWVAAAGVAERARRSRVVFSVKEAVYKAFYPRTRTFWGFEDVSVEIDLDAEAWRAWLPESAGVPEAEGRVARRDGWIVSTAVLPPDPGAGRA